LTSAGTDAHLLLAAEIGTGHVWAWRASSGVPSKTMGAAVRLGRPMSWPVPPHHRRIVLDDDERVAWQRAAGASTRRLRHVGGQAVLGSSSTNIVLTSEVPTRS